MNDQPRIIPPQMPKPDPAKLTANYNRMVGSFVNQMIEPVIKGGGGAPDVLLMLQGIITGVLFVVAKPEADDKMVDMIAGQVKLSLAEMRKKHVTDQAVNVTDAAKH